MDRRGRSERRRDPQAPYEHPRLWPLLKGADPYVMRVNPARGEILGISRLCRDLICFIARSPPALIAKPRASHYDQSIRRIFLIVKLVSTKGKLCESIDLQLIVTHDPARDITPYTFWIKRFDQFRKIRSAVGPSPTDARRSSRY